MKRGLRTLNVYQAKDGFRWNLWYAGKVVSESGQAYKRRPTAINAALTYGVPAGNFPIKLVCERYIKNRVVVVAEMLR